MDELTRVILLIGAVGAVGGLVGGLVATSRASLMGSVVMGVLGGLATAAVLRIAGVPPIFEAGEGFSYLYGLGGGLLLGFVVSASNK
jgi:hypothetical protein